MEYCLVVICSLGISASLYISNQHDVEPGSGDDLVEPPSTSRRGADPEPARPADLVRNGAMEGPVPGTSLYVVSLIVKPVCQGGHFIGCHRTLYKDLLTWTPFSHSASFQNFRPSTRLACLLHRWVCLETGGVAECSVVHRENRE